MLAYAGCMSVYWLMIGNPCCFMVRLYKCLPKTGLSSTKVKPQYINSTPPQKPSWRDRGFSNQEISKKSVNKKSSLEKQYKKTVHPFANAKDLIQIERIIRVASLSFISFRNLLVLVVKPTYILYQIYILSPEFHLWKWNMIISETKVKKIGKGIPVMSTT